MQEQREKRDVTIALMAIGQSDWQTQCELNMAAAEIAEVVRKRGFFQGVTVLSLSGKFDLENVAAEAESLVRDRMAVPVPLQRDGTGTTDPPKIDDEPVHPAETEPESRHDDVLLRLSRAGVPITYKLIGGKKVARLGRPLSDEQVESIEAFFSRFSIDQRVLVVGGMTGEEAAAVLAGAPEGTRVYSHMPQGDNDFQPFSDDDLNELQRQIGVRIVDVLPESSGEVDTIVVGQGIAANRVFPWATRLIAHAKQPGGFLIGVEGGEVMREYGAQVHASGLWAISASKLAKALQPKPQEVAGV